jgi:hypothetical protein
MKIAANIISWVFMPLLMPIYGLLITMYLPSFEAGYYQLNTIYFLNPQLKIAILSLFGLFSFLAPALSLVLLMRTKVISSIQVDIQKERNLPMIITALYAGFFAWFLWNKTPQGILPTMIYLYPLGSFTAVIIAIILNGFEKISLHGLGTGMFLAYIISYYQLQLFFPFWIIIASTLLCGLILTSRLILVKHTLKQVFLGFIVGFTTLYITFHLR